MALLVVPLAGFMMRSSYNKYRRKWIVAAGSLGIVFILTGAAAPYVEQAAVPGVSTEGEDAGVSGSAADGCTDSCCPSVQAGDEGGWTVHIPTASILTTLGGVFLIVTHVGNLWLCRCMGCQAE